MNISQAKAMFKDIVRKVTFTPNEYRILANIVAKDRVADFMRGVGPDGEKWKPLSPKTIARKRGEHSTIRARKGTLRQTKARNASEFPDKPLIDSGQLMKTTVTADTKGGHVRLAQSRSISVKGGASISEIHDKGLGNNPQRHHWGISAQTEKTIRDEADRLIKVKVDKIIAEYR